ncbi:phospholipase A [Undibacterium crateris]|uniref:phospholipase A n=1 Tax=Undibacterium crateris TaxID=2528175 RepID=UPI00138A007D|nr:phospholipase A [Undibacterium crateris]NDI86193.1 phospholipase [Undibacterium crateris]
MKKKNWMLVSAVLPFAALAQQQDCSQLAQDAERLACYDRLYGKPAKPISAQISNETGGAPQRTEAPVAAASPATREVDGLSERWELDSANAKSLFFPKPYKPVYILPVAYSNRINAAPFSPAPGHQADKVDLDSVEAKFQLSFKSKIMENVLGTKANLWGAYTQSSRWQVYNGGLSRPFRETNYEPEAMLVYPLSFDMLGWQTRMASLGINHQSNGRALPLSRSWNRIIGELAMEKGDWSISLRPWWRIKESEATDDNPSIQDYAGRGELLVTRKTGKHIFTFQGRHSLRSGQQSRGSVQLDWAFPLLTGLHGYVQIFSGYGESMIDYNFRQTRVGMGVSLVEWR